MKVYLIRHGATPGNLEKRYVGTTDEPLTKDAVTALKKLRVRYPIPVQVVTSPLKRCMQTASLLFPGIPSECCDGLKECDFGRFEYHNYMELSQDAEYQRWIDSNGTLPFPGGESQKSFQERCCQAFLESVAALRQAGCASVAYVVHGGTIMALMERFCTEEKSYFDWQVKNQEGFACEIQNAARVTADARFMQLTDRLPLPEERLHKSGIEDVYVVQKNERLQCGYTTGSCATAASLAATRMLFTGKICRDVRLLTPKGVSLDLEIVQPVIGEGRASCAVRKFGGDDPDATDGLLIFAEAKQVSREDAAERPVPDLPDTDAVLIGGMDRGIDYSELIQFLNECSVPNIILMEATGKRIFEEISKYYPEFKDAGRIKLVYHLDGAVALAKQLCRPGCCCVMSPAAASYGIFKNFEARGEAFVKLVLEEA